ncbi:hypothetical protein QR680_001130 [Steinernema hermaphroditum]|uniref:Uncharacterized protein n=1 Tax=Steinernema hermaphroditum TaxID=289476 RepID=A0AA39GX20_9BILA|nr:hypothetical protein QR680_001130 [Steinernema hermaphroditum]
MASAYFHVHSLCSPQNEPEADIHPADAAPEVCNFKLKVLVVVAQNNASSSYDSRGDSDISCQSLLLDGGDIVTVDGDNNIHFNHHIHNNRQPHDNNINKNIHDTCLYHHDHPHNIYKHSNEDLNRPSRVDVYRLNLFSSTINE